MTLPSGYLTRQPKSLQEVCRAFHAGEVTLEDTLADMKEDSCSVSLSWCEDDRDCWECSWIVGGKRYTSMHETVRLAVLGALNKCFLALICAESRIRNMMRGGEHLRLVTALTPNSGLPNISHNGKRSKACEHTCGSGSTSA